MRISALSIIAAPAASAVLLLTAACSGGTAAAPSGATATPAPPEIGNAVELTATDNVFATTAYTVSAGQTYTLTLKNQGQAIHNWHVAGVKGSDGKEIETPLTEAGKSSSTSFAITKPGTYPFQCDVHPDTMKGTLTVK